MTHYIGILDGHDDVWGVRIPDLPGCLGGGSSPEAAIRDAVSAMAEWVQDRQDRDLAVPQARSAGDLMRDPAIRADMLPGDAFVVLPLIVESGRPTRANISLDAGLLQSIDMAAKARGLTRSAFLASAAREKILAEV
jgi:predicted RNase H-like HicB family nuclease